MMIISFGLVIITSHLILLSPISQVNADPILIARTCDRSYHSNYCNACFDSLKGLTSHQDLRGLGGSAIYCAFRKFMATHGPMEHYYSTEYAEYVPKCPNCMDQFNLAIEHVMEGMRLWRTSSYADSGAQLKWAADQLFDCAYCWRDLTRSDEEVKVTSLVIHSDGYLDAASGTIRQLLPDYDPNSR
ncbi:hypothetical protein LINGRAHAP2_LOCUS19792 [Linum grandiflorum]